VAFVSPALGGFSGVGILIIGDALKNGYDNKMVGLCQRLIVTNAVVAFRADLQGQISRRLVTP